MKRLSKRIIARKKLSYLGDIGDNSVTLTVGVEDHIETLFLDDDTLMVFIEWAIEQGIIEEDEL